MNKNVLLIYLFFIQCGLVQNSFSQEEYTNHPELHWYTITTGHFQVHYHEGAERTGRTVAKIAEEIYGPITQLYNWHPDGPIHFIIKDHDDNSNGAAFYYDNKVEIWAPQMTFILRGTHNWLRNVVTHEFSHMISLGASRKMTRSLPAFYFQWIDYESEKRPDVLYGYPNVISSYPLPMTIMPMWLAEGMAQIQTPGLQYDLWDSHRDMLIRTAVIAGKQLTFSQMGVFGKNSLGNERTYNAGYALTRYIVAHWGESALEVIADKMSRPLSFTVNGAIKSSTGLSASDLYDQWREEMAKYYRQRLSAIDQHRIEGETLTPKGIGNTFPTWSPDGKYLAYCGSKSSDYLTLTNLQLYDTSTRKSRILKSGVNSAICWSSDNKSLIYARIKRGEHGSHFSDLFRFDLIKKKERQLTMGLRAFDPALSPDGSQIVCVVQKDGTDNLLLVEAKGKAIRRLTTYSNGEALGGPRWSPDGRTVVFSQARNHGREILLFDVENNQIRPFIKELGDARDPVFSRDGHSIYFSWDTTGIFNIYSKDLDEGQIQQWTNVQGGAFMPSVSCDGALAFSNFQYDGYKISQIIAPVAVEAEFSRYVAADNAASLGLQESEIKPELSHLRSYDDSQLPDYQAKPYEMSYGQVAFLPRIMVDYRTLKLGTYFYSSDMLDRYSMFGGATLNTRLDLDAFAIFEMRRLPPTIFLELYAFTRHINRTIEVYQDDPRTVNVDIGFRILEADLGIRYPITDGQMLRAAYVHSRYSNKIGEFFFDKNKWVSPENTYFIGNQFNVTWNLDHTVRRVDSEINPSAGRRLNLKYSYEMNQFFKDFATDNEYGTAQEIYTHYNYHRIEFDWHDYHTMPWLRKHTLTGHLQAGWIDRKVDDFFNFFAGGLPGLRGYPFYSIEGRKLVLGRLTYRLPLFSNWQKRFLWFTTDKAYASGFVECGNAFNGDVIYLDQLKKDIGVSVRLSAFSFYGYPTALELTAAYGLDTVENQAIKYGKEWRYYATLLFDFID